MFANHSVRKLLSSRLTSKKSKVRIYYKIIILPVVLYECKTWSLILGVKRKLLGCLRTGC
jgi:hypothetical protein